ncbi:MAG: nitroreductase family protein [Saccharofermentanales bacterium]
METIDVIKSRVSIRKYKHLPVSREILEDIIDCGRLAPSGYNHQPYVFVVITDQQVRDRIAEAAVYGRFISDAGACAAIFCRKGEETMMEDACAAAENIIIAAQAYGLGTCWVNSYKKELSSEVKTILGCPDEYELMVLIAIGHPDETKKTPKKPLDEVLKWNKFS